MKLKYITIAIIASLVLMLTGCNKLVSEEEITTSVTITDIYRRGSRYVGGVISYPRYRVYFDYDGYKLVSSQRSVYKQLKDKVDEDVEIVLIKKTYEDDTTKYEFKELVE